MTKRLSARFEHPASLAEARRLTAYQKRRILRAWQQAAAKQAPADAPTPRDAPVQRDIYRGLRRLRHRT